jgi:hypothetical protein
VRYGPIPALLCLLSALLIGCGGDGVSSRATVSVYVSAPLCAGAKRELAKSHSRTGSLHVRAVCLTSQRSGSRLDLAKVGANARRATEDSTSVAYLEAPDRRAVKFAHPILESAQIAWISSSSGSSAMGKVLKALGERGSSDPRSAVFDSLSGG